MGNTTEIQHYNTHELTTLWYLTRNDPSDNSWDTHDTDTLHTILINAIPFSPPHDITQFLDAFPPTAIESILTHHDLPPYIFAHFVDHPSPHVRHRVAGNPHISPTTLASPSLLQPGLSEQIVRQNLAQNPSTPPHTLTQIAHNALRTGDEHTYVLITLLNNPATPPETVELLAEKHPDALIRSWAQLAQLPLKHTEESKK